MTDVTDATDATDATDVTDVTDAPTTFDVDCPHCKKTFSAELMAGSAERYNGFKCPHCRLFVPLKRRDR